MPKRTALDGRTVTLIVGIIVAIFIALSALMFTGSDTSEPQGSSQADTDTRTSHVLKAMKTGMKKVVAFMSYVK